MQIDIVRGETYDVIRIRFTICIYIYTIRIFNAEQDRVPYGLW